MQIFGLQKLLPIFVTQSLRLTACQTYMYKEKTMKKIFCATIISCLALNAFAQYGYNVVPFNINDTPKNEVRAVWLTTLANLDWPKTHATSEYTIEQQKRELTDILDKYAAANINTVLLQTRVRAATIYPSSIEPWDQCITGQEGGNPGFGYDPLKFAVDECHKRGMELHAWIAAIPVGASKSLGCRMLKQKGFSIRSYSTGSYVNPADPKIADYLAEICGEITRNYDVDGINLDYIRYPDGWPKPSNRSGDTPDDRRYNITKIVKAIHDKVKSIKPWVKISCSPIGKHSDLSRYSSKNYNARERVSQDAQLWLEKGYMDQLYPMQYFRGDNYYPFCADWMENSDGKDVVTGLGTYFLDPREGNWTLGELKRQMHVSRSLGMGHAHFRSRFLTDNLQGVYNFEKEFNSNLALPPAMTWMGKRKPATPTYDRRQNDLKTIGSDNRVSLSWSGNSPYYNIYASYDYPVDISDSRNLVFARFSGNSLSFTEKGHHDLHFAVTSMDRFGNESSALQEYKASYEEFESHFIENDGKTLNLSKQAQRIDIDYLEIKSLSGNTIKRIYPVGKRMQADIYALPNGVYTIYAHSKKKDISHRLGYFIIKR